MATTATALTSSIATVPANAPLTVTASTRTAAAATAQFSIINSDYAAIAARHLYAWLGFDFSYKLVKDYTQES